MKSSLSAKRLVLVVAALSILGLTVRSLSAQSFWEKRQERLEEMRKKQLKKSPQDKRIITPETSPIPEEEKVFQPFQEEEFKPSYREGDFALPPLEEYKPVPGLGLKKFGLILGKNEYLNPEIVRIPEEYGTIKEVHNEGADSKLIIHIQDAHANYDAQISIAHITEELLINYGVNTVLLEGGLKEDVGVGDLKWTGFRSTRIKVTGKLVKEGKYSGVEYLDAISPYPLVLRGLEDTKLYYASGDLQLEILDSRDEPKKKMQELQLTIRNLKVGIYNKDLQEFDAKKKDYNEEKITLTEYSMFLEKKAESVNIKKKAPNFNRLLQTITLEKEIDFPGVDDDRVKLIDELSKGKDKETSDELVQKSLDFRQGKLTAIEFYTYLKDKYKRDLAKSYPNLGKYTRYITIHGNIDTHSLFSEMDTVEWDIRAEYYDNKDQKTLDKLSRNLKILEGLFGLELTPDEYAYYQKNKKEFIGVKKWVADLDKLREKMNLSQPIKVNVRQISDKISLMDRFYRNTYERDEAFMKKAEEAFAKTNKNTVIMVTGGFHTPNLIELFNDHDYSYIVIAPKIDNPTPKGLYDRVIRQAILDRKKRKQ